MTVAPAKGDGARAICLKCFYVKRGSFKGLKLGALLKLMRKNSPLRDKFLGGSDGSDLSFSETSQVLDFAFSREHAFFVIVLWV